MEPKTVDINRSLIRGMILEERHNAPIRRLYYKLLFMVILSTIVVMIGGILILLRGG